MKKIEAILAHQLNDDKAVPYPDFEKLWCKMEQEGHTTEALNSLEEVRSGPKNTQLKTFTPRRHRNWRKITIAASISALLAVVPVYAAVHYDWDTLLQNRSGIKAALEQNLGQSLEKSVTHNGVTLTLHTAVVDEDRTVILYSLGFENKIGNKDAVWNFKRVALQDSNGNIFEGNRGYQLWDENNQQYNGYFETDWSPKHSKENVQFVVDDLQEYGQKERNLSLNIDSNEIQSFIIGQDGLNKIDVKTFKQNGEKILLSSAVTFDDPKAKEWAFPRILAYRNGSPVMERNGGAFGTPGENGEYTAQQYFNLSNVPKEQTTYKLQYTTVDKRVTGPWKFDLGLSKKQMENGTIKTSLHVPLEETGTDNMFEEMVVTPTQIRVTLKNNKKHTQLPYTKYFLDVNGSTLEGVLWSSPQDDPYLTTLHFERPLDLQINNDTPITFVGKYKVTYHDGEKKPLLLTHISAKKQSLTEQIGGYQVKWTYYMQDGNLYVETESESPLFGGVNQTYIGLGKDRILGKPLTVNFSGDGNNKAIDVYKDYKGTEASIYMFYYSTDEPDKETRVKLHP